MTDEVTYLDWSAGYGGPSGSPAYDEAEAIRRWQAEETFFVLFGDPEHPNPVLEIELGGEQITVTWLDHLNRPVLDYFFTEHDEVPAGTLFLEQVGINEYLNETPLPEGDSEIAEAYYFNPDGPYFAVRTEPANPRLETNGVLDADQLALQMEPKPVFGDWASIIRRER